MTSPNSSSAQVDNYLTLSPKAQAKILNQLYHNEELTYSQIAEKLGTYANKIRRDAQKFGLKSRTMSEAQALSTKKGRKHSPTLGKKLSTETREKISKTLSNTYHALSDEEKEQKKKIAQEQWKNKSAKERMEFHKSAARAIRNAAVLGSKLEQYLLDVLVKNDYRVEYHKSHTLQNDLLHIDLFLPELNIAIEVDGPVHSRKIWTDEELAKRQRTDNQKTALILSKDLILIRINQSQNITRKFKDDVSSLLLEKIRDIVANPPKREDRYIKI